MNISPELYTELNKAWNSTCRVVLGEEIGELKEFEEWLGQHVPRHKPRKSSISGKDVSFAMSNYCDDAKFVSMDEVDETKQAEPLNINEIKDIDSILEAISDKWTYVGNKVLGNSKFVELSDTVVDSQYVYDTTNIGSYQYGAIVYNSGNCKYVFGSAFAGRTEFMIGSIGVENSKRIFGCSDISDCGEAFLSHNCRFCQDILFSYHQINKRNCIGNLELPKDKYLGLKKKILSEIAGELRKNKTFHHVFTLVPDKPAGMDLKATIGVKEPEFNMDSLNREFSSIFKTVLKLDISDILPYGDWLLRNTIPLKEQTTPFGSTFQMSTHPNYPIWNNFPKSRLVNYEESLKLKEIHMEEESITGLDSVRDWFSGTCYLCADYSMGNNRNYAKSTVLVDSNNIYGSYVVIKSENIGFTAWPLLSKNILGSFVADKCQFCINVYNSDSLTRCFELDSCVRCTDTYFSHNCEGLVEAMFCWNTKGKRYAIGNFQLPSTNYREIKESVLQQIGNELEQKKELKLNIFNIGCQSMV